MPEEYLLTQSKAGDQSVGDSSPGCRPGRKMTNRRNEVYLMDNSRHTTRDVQARLDKINEYKSAHNVV